MEAAGSPEQLVNVWYTSILEMEVSG
jgi:hypothetical protein